MVHISEIKESGTCQILTRRKQLHITVIEPYFLANESIFQAD